MFVFRIFVDYMDSIFEEFILFGFRWCLEEIVVLRRLWNDMSCVLVWVFSWWRGME